MLALNINQSINRSSTL